MELRLLGPVEVSTGDRLWEVGPPQRRHVLAALAVDAARPVTTETLIDRVWDEAPPGARRTLQVHLTHLRRLLERVTGGETTLLRRSGGYVLDLEPSRVDLHRFRELVRRSRSAAEPAPLLREARALWRGEPLAGLAGEWAAGSRQAWRRWYGDATVAWARAELAAANPDEVIGPLLDLAAEQPLAESVAAVLLRALHAAGRSAEALRHYADLRDHLAAELGADPGAELQAVHQAILRGEPDPPPAARPAAAVVPPLLPADVPGFAGRDEHLSRLDKLLARPASGTSTAVVISAVSGTAGVGKTALAVHWAHTVADQFPDGRLYVNLRGFEPSGRVMDPAEAVRGFLDALGVPPSRIPPDPDAQVARYRALLAGRRVLIVLDNARDAEQVRPLLPGTPSALVLVTSRNQLTGLIVTEGAHPLALDVLSPAESRDLLIQRLGNDRVAGEPRAVREIIDACARLPLALSVAAARAQQTGFPLAALAAELGEAGRRLSALDAGDPVSDVRAVFSWSYATLTPSAARLFRLLGLHPGADLATGAAAALAGEPVPGVRAQLAQLARANLLVEHAPGRYTQHDLLRTYAAELTRAHDSADARRHAESRLLAYYTHTACAANRLLYPTLEPIAVPLDPPPSGVAPEHLADHGSALAWLAAEHANLLAALGRAAESGAHAVTWQLAWGLDTFQYRQWHWHDHAATWLAAVTAARRLGHATAEGYAHRRLSDAEGVLNHPEAAYEHAEQALRLFSAAADRFGEGCVHLDLSMLAERQGDNEQALAHARRALDVAREIGHERQQARALNTVGWFHALLGDQAAALDFCGEALAVNLRLGDTESTAMTLDSIGFAYRNLGDHGPAVASYERAIAIYRELGYSFPTADTLVRLGETHEAAGHPEAARAAWHEALKIFLELGHSMAAEVRAKLRALGGARGQG
ncbi:AfsR/SARP family transcriptional regulator [Actinoplanes nipponensis]|uniref:SARP family transcriptional regulator n=1 Tax=Actinoplanes nipponensis TaxID=135950 RepID=A0A919JSF6_9ACTN|nr:BTAD domain-containing putative transcriptional regulator [Actinoplanes nipponensis]GIE54572.1 SARP family transcriptional regulator [Actinoplanes nipponensis]